VRAADMTFNELVAAAVSNVTMPDLRAISLTGLYLTFTRPIMVVGAMLLAFALTARYRRRGNYGGALLQGLVVGFVLFVLNEMAIRAGNAQVITPLAATAGPALVSVLVGLTALLFLEDGYA
jgi:lipopolysaccharide export system permease protein